jgi:hypothetical protein
MDAGALSHMAGQIVHPCWMSGVGPTGRLACLRHRHSYLAQARRRTRTTPWRHRHRRGLHLPQLRARPRPLRRSVFSYVVPPRSQRNTAGFAGVQLPQVSEGSPPPLDIYTPSTDTWTTVYPAPDPEHGFPGPRSVHGLVPFSTGAHTNTSGPVPIALLYHGERDASSLGHAGAGVFWDDAWLLLATSTSGLRWKKLRVDGT